MNERRYDTYTIFYNESTDDWTCELIAGGHVIAVGRGGSQEAAFKDAVGKLDYGVGKNTPQIIHY